MEIFWKDILGYEELYQVCDTGSVRNKKTGKVLAGCKRPDGYVQLNLYKNGKPTMFKIHRLVGLAFLPNFFDKPTVDHRNGDRSDNRLYNLRWASYEEQGANRVGLENGFYTEEMRRYNKSIYEKNKEAIAKTSKIYYEKNKDEINEKTKKYKQENKEAIKEYQQGYRQANKDKIIEKNKIYYEKNREAIAKRDKIYYEANKDKIIEKSKIYYEANKKYRKEKEAKNPQMTLKVINM